MMEMSLICLLRVCVRENGNKQDQGKGRLRVVHMSQQLSRDKGNRDARWYLRTLYIVRFHPCDRLQFILFN